MLHVDNISKWYNLRRGRRKMVFDQATLMLPHKANTGVLGRNGAGKSTLMRMLSGAEPPSKGRIFVGGSISWPLGLTPNFHPQLTGRHNARFVLRVNGIPYEQLRDWEAYINDVAELGSSFDQPFGTYSSGMRIRLGFATSICFDFDWLLIDEVMEVGDEAFKRKSRTLLEAKLENSSVILVSHTYSRLREWCTQLVLVWHGKLEFFDDIEVGIREYHQRVVKERGEVLSG